jgi:hypothetical protein
MGNYFTSDTSISITRHEMTNKLHFSIVGDRTYNYVTTNDAIILGEYAAWIFMVKYDGYRVGIPTLSVYKNGVTVPVTALTAGFDANTNLPVISISEVYIFKPLSSANLSCYASGSLVALQVYDYSLNSTQLASYTSFLDSMLSKAAPSFSPSFSPSYSSVVDSSDATAYSIIATVLPILACCGCFGFFVWFCALKKAQSPSHPVTDNYGNNSIAHENVGRNIPENVHPGNVNPQYGNFSPYSGPIPSAPMATVVYPMNSNTVPSYPFPNEQALVNSNQAGYPSYQHQYPAQQGFSQPPVVQPWNGTAPPVMHAYGQSQPPNLYPAAYVTSDPIAANDYNSNVEMTGYNVIKNGEY